MSSLFHDMRKRNITSVIGLTITILSFMMVGYLIVEDWPW